MTFPVAVASPDPIALQLVEIDPERTQATKEMDT
jgi:hypothetical protein